MSFTVMIISFNRWRLFLVFFLFVSSSFFTCSFKEFVSILDTFCPFMLCRKLKMASNKHTLKDKIYTDSYLLDPHIPEGLFRVWGSCILFGKS